MNSAYILLFLFYLSKHVQRSHQAYGGDPKDDPIYKQKTGKTYEELIKSGQYVPYPSTGGKLNTSHPIWQDFEAADSSKFDNRGGLDFFGSREDEVKFILCTPSNKKGIEIANDAQEIKNAGWNSDNELKILIHGYTMSAQSDTMPQRVKNAYISTNVKANIILLEWGKYAGGNYFTACSNTVPVAEYLGAYMEFLSGAGLIKNYDSVHLIGFSLGAHLAGDVGAYFKRKGVNIGRITGLDPAGPGYYKTSNRLDQSDATFVDVIHTNIGDSKSFLKRFSLGTDLISGDVDFFPNGGLQQPGCGLILIGELIGTCSHNKAVEYFVDTIFKKDKYFTCPCSSWEKFQKNTCECGKKFIMGEYTSTDVRGSHFLRT